MIECHLIYYFPYKEHTFTPCFQFYILIIIIIYFSSNITHFPQFQRKNMTPVKGLHFCWLHLRRLVRIFTDEWLFSPFLSLRIWPCYHFLARLFKEYESYTTHPGVGVHVTLWLTCCMQVLKYYMYCIETFYNPT